MAPIRFRPLTLLTALAAVAAAPAQAEESHGTWLVGLSPLGTSVGYGLRLSDKWSGRLYLNSGSTSRIKTDNVSLGDNRWDADVRIGSGISALADYAPWADSGWHLTTGLVLARANPGLTARADGSGGYTLNGHRYSGAEVGKLTGELRNRPAYGYLGGGWDSKPAGEPGWRFTSDVGLLLSSRPKASLTASGAAGNAALQQDLAAEQRNLQRWGLGLVVQLGAAYAF